MKNYLLSGLLLISTGFIAADGHMAAEQEVLKALDAYMEARNSRDFKTVVAMSSKAGTLDTNSDGSFHKPLAKQTVESWKKGGGAVTQHFYAEATALADDVVHVRFYSEGMVGDEGNMSDYRTRVTMNWVKENNKWVVRSAHYSPASYGGVHKTQAGDFED
jgi:ketosteroid isomerase-like protein